MKRMKNKTITIAKEKTKSVKRKIQLKIYFLFKSLQFITDKISVQNKSVQKYSLNRVYQFFIVSPLPFLKNLQFYANEKCIQIKQSISILILLHSDRTRYIFLKGP